MSNISDKKEIADGYAWGNKLIAEFEGKTFREDNGDGECGYLFPVNGYFNRRLMPEQMQYQNSWDLLIPIVQSISNIDIESNTLLGDIFDSLLCLDRKRTWEAVAQYLKWYNYNLKNNL